MCIGQASAQEYYPLKIGNRWDYFKTCCWEPPPWCRGTGCTDTLSIRVIGDSLFPNGKRYFVLNEQDMSGGRYVRADSNGVYYYRGSHSADVVFYKLSASPGEEWNVRLGAAYTVRLLQNDTLTIFDRTTKVLNFLFHLSDGSIDPFIRLSDKFGPYECQSGSPWSMYTYMKLIGCILSDTVYGRLTAVGETAQVPSDFQLFQNFPNPFNPSATIRYSLATATDVRLTVYNVLGQEVAVLVSGIQSAGLHEIRWNARGFPSGIYFCRLRFDKHNETRKTVLLQ